MLEKILRLYAAAMLHDVRSPMPHLVGPPGCGKSTVVQQAADVINCCMHTINLSRVSPLELEGVQMPVTEDGEAMKLRLLHATFWTQIKEGDIVLFDEALRAFPEVFNGLLDILTSRQVAGLQLPRFFAIAASNTIATYDKALEDRLLHLPVEDPRKSAHARKRMAQLLVDAIGLHPRMGKTSSMDDLLNVEVLPMFNMLDQLTGGNKGDRGSSQIMGGKSLRNLIGQALMREVQSPQLEELLAENNRLAIRESKYQFVILKDGKAGSTMTGYHQEALSLVGNEKLTEVQAKNLDLNLQLIEMESLRKTKGIPDESDISEDDIFS